MTVQGEKKWNGKKGKHTHRQKSHARTRSRSFTKAQTCNETHKSTCTLPAFSPQYLPPHTLTRQSNENRPWLLLNLGLGCLLASPPFLVREILSFSFSLELRLWPLPHTHTQRQTHATRNTHIHRKTIHTHPPSRHQLSSPPLPPSPSPSPSFPPSLRQTKRISS